MWKISRLKNPQVESPEKLVEDIPLFLKAAFLSIEGSSGRLMNSFEMRAFIIPTGSFLVVPFERLQDSRNAD
ncbi:hypothetical protein A0U91_16375 (plasmid) [Acetobacter persici]|uniref:Uncharacterized protein n=1 Tax=Acetobacter persici TaxID=1076596 RepID=A0A1U9LJE6_9PROT|nr:hypothetical protein A0U91_16375 [Acetobacter persici]